MQKVCLFGNFLATGHEAFDLAHAPEFIEG